MTVTVLSTTRFSYVKVLAVIVLISLYAATSMISVNWTSGGIKWSLHGLDTLYTAHNGISIKRHLRSHVAETDEGDANTSEERVSSILSVANLDPTALKVAATFSKIEIPFSEKITLVLEKMSTSFMKFLLSCQKWKLIFPFDASRLYVIFKFPSPLEDICLFTQPNFLEWVDMVAEKVKSESRGIRKGEENAFDEKLYLEINNVLGKKMGRVLLKAHLEKLNLALRKMELSKTPSTLPKTLVDIELEALLKKDRKNKDKLQKLVNALDSIPEKPVKPVSLLRGRAYVRTKTNLQPKSNN
ncbi:unnamed protein product [Peronospora belbahrii]|uniref:Uncharacterized protein n=1 Tax=Peronospora belbahrii TaxID=622444 RepID=A0AAU9L4H1_9STRA|nr:unnamed protein product [Peronospora belbahrii]